MSEPENARPSAPVFALLALGACLALVAVAGGVALLAWVSRSAQPPAELDAPWGTCEIQGATIALRSPKTTIKGSFKRLPEDDLEIAGARRAGSAASETAENLSLDGCLMKRS